jgi:hypothetical protein
MRNWIDKNLNRFVSKKLLVFTVATCAFFLGHLPSESWVELVMVYLGSQGAIDAIGALRNGSK